MNAVPSTHMRKRSCMPTSSPIRNTSTHIAQGLKPSSAASTTVRTGSDRSAMATVPMNGT